MARRTLVPLLLAAVLGSLLAAAAWAEKSKPAREDYYELYKILVDTMDQVERNYVKDVDRRELVEAAIQGVLSKLDPYSAYISPDQMSSFRTSVHGEFGGIGIRLAPDPGQLTIFSPLVGTPAYRAGLLAGDRIVEIGGESTDAMTLDEAVRRLKGEPGTDVTLTVIHRGTNEKLEVTITRESIHIDTVLGDHRKEDDTWDFMLKPDEHIGYVRITAFSRDTAGELRKVLEQLRAEEMRGLILDLRFNPGGLLSSAIEVSDLFISEGRIVSTEGRNTSQRSWDARKDGTFEGFPMVVLVNHYSASASEIVSACLQDHRRAVVMGERTWGKGSVQNVIELEFDPQNKKARSALKLTTASYRRPSGKNIHRFRESKDEDEWGVTPDEGFQMKLGDAELMGLMDARRERDIVRPHRANQAAPDQPDERPADQAAEASPDEPDESDTGQKQEPKPDDESDESSEPAGDTPQDDGSAQGSDKSKTEASERPAFVDRQLQMAIDYLSGELARAE